MNKIAFLVQNNHVLHMTIPVAQYTWSRPVDLIDRSSYDGFDVDNSDIDWSQYDFVFVFGSVQFMREMIGTSLGKHIFYENGGVWATYFWTQKFGTRSVNSQGRLMYLKDVLPFLSKFGSWHVRPNSFDKAFTAAVFSKSTWATVLQERVLADDLVCFVSPIQDIHSEYRCWIVDGRIVDISKYCTRGELDKERMSPNSQLWADAQRLADHFLPASHVVMDVAEMEDGELKFLEFNAIHSSGWYAADIPTVLDALIEWSKAKK